MKKKLRFEEAMTRLEEIAALLSSGQVELEDSLALFAEGAELIKLCEKQLGDARLKIETLFPRAVLEGENDE